MQETWVRSLGWEDPLEKGKATHSSILVCRIPCTVWSMGLQRVRHNQVTKHRTSRESIPYLPGCCLQSKPTNPQTEGQKVVEGLACDRPCLLLQGPPVSPAGSQDTQWLCLNEVLSEWVTVSTAFKRDYFWKIWLQVPKGLIVFIYFSILQHIGEVCLRQCFLSFLKVWLQSLRLL